MTNRAPKRPAKSARDSKAGGRLSGRRTSRAASLTVAFAVVSAAFSTAAQLTFEQSRANAVRLLDRGTITDKEQPLREGRRIFAELLDRRLEPGEAVIAHYSVAYADWRIVGLTETSAANAAPLLEDAIRQLQEALKLDSRHADASALLGSVYGAQIGVEPSRAMFFLPLISNALERATSLQPANPRVVLLRAINSYLTPPEYGGGAEAAEPLFERALALFDNESRGSDWPNWGRLDALAYLGQVKAERGDRKGARAAYEKALDLAPDYRRVRVLMSRMNGSGR